MVLIDLFLIAFIIVYCLDYSGFVEEVESLLTKKFKSPIPFTMPKPIFCSRCQVWWIGLIYLIIVHKFTLINIALVALMSALTNEVLQLQYFIKDTVITVINSIRILLGIREN